MAGTAKATLSADVICRTKAAMADIQWETVAAICNTQESWDLAFRQDVTRAVVRCVSRARPTDYRALKTMLQQGDFDRALLVHTGPALTAQGADIETCTIDDLPEVLARWERSP